MSTSLCSSYWLRRDAHEGKITLFFQMIIISSMIIIPSFVYIKIRYVLAKKITFFTDKHFSTISILVYSFIIKIQEKLIK